MAAVLAHRRSEYFGLRPMDPMKDLNGVADLIEQAFASELDRAGQSALRELRWLSRLRPILWWMVYTNPDHSDFLSGFVWEEEGKIVGNITINRTSPGSRRWLISNLAVDKDYQRRGIARSLMDAALELVKEYNGSSISLQVRADNAPARRLYESLNFKEISGTAYLRARRVPKVEANLGLLELPNRVLLRPRTANALDTRLAYNLATVAMPLTAQKEWPLRQSSFQLNSQEKISSFFRRFSGSGPILHWAVEDGQRFVGLADVTPGIMGKMHQINLIVHPDWRGYLERPLISRILNYLYRWRSNEIRVKHPADHTEAIEIYRALGFHEIQTLLWLKREM